MAWTVNKRPDLLGFPVNDQLAGAAQVFGVTARNGHFQLLELRQGGSLVHQAHYDRHAVDDCFGPRGTARDVEAHRDYLGDRPDSMSSSPSSFTTGECPGQFPDPPRIAGLPDSLHASGGNEWSIRKREPAIKPTLRPAHRESLGRNNMNTRTSRKSGFTLVEIMIVVSIIGLVAAIAIPNFVRARATSNQTTCINNLRQVGGAIAQWALENNASTNTTVQYSDIQPYMHGSVVCPTGGTSFGDSYAISDVQTAPTCKLVPTGPDAHCLPDTSQ